LISGSSRRRKTVKRKLGKHITPGDGQGKEKKKEKEKEKGKDKGKDEQGED
jgi:hypothetical protein